MLLISIEIAAGLSLPRRADGALRFQKQTKQDSATFYFLTQSRLKVPKPQQASGREQNALSQSWVWEMPVSCSLLQTRAGLSTPWRRAVAFLQSFLPDVLPINPFKEWVTLYFLHTRCTNSVLPFTAKSGMEGRMKMKGEWKGKHSIQKWNSFLNWYCCSFLTFKWSRLKTSKAKPTHKVMYRNVMSNATVKMC